MRRRGRRGTRTGNRIEPEATRTLTALLVPLREQEEGQKVGEREGGIDR